jgi:hypothetical protein
MKLDAAALRFAWWADHFPAGKPPSEGMASWGDYSPWEQQQARLAVQDILTAIGETHVLVPRIETDEMCEAGLEALRENLGHSSVIMRDAAACYRAMLASAKGE